MSETTAFRALPEPYITSEIMPLVARLGSGVRIEQYHKDHNPPHFHAIHQDDEVLIEIAWPLHTYAGGLAPRLMNEVRAWARLHRAGLALNWVDALARQAIGRLP